MLERTTDPLRHMKEWPSAITGVAYFHGSQEHVLKTLPPSWSWLVLDSPGTHEADAPAALYCGFMTHQ